MSAVHPVEALSFKVSPALDQAVNRIGELARELGDKDREIDKLRHEVASLKNKHIRPMDGHRLFNTWHSNAPVALEYEFEPAERGSRDEPSYPASADLYRVWIGGQPFGAKFIGDEAWEAFEAECLARETGADE